MLILSLLFACENEPTGPEEEPVDSEKAERYVASADSVITEMVEAAEEDPSVSEMFDYYEAAGELYKDAVAADPGNSRANFGAAVFGYQGIINHPDVKLMRDTLEDWDSNLDQLDNARYYTTQLFMHGKGDYLVREDHKGEWYEDIDPWNAFSTLIYFVQGSLSNQNVVELVQDVVDDVLIANINESITYLDRVITDEDFVYLITPEMSGDDDVVELDLGEVYMISAVMRLSRACLTIINAYQLSIPGIESMSDYYTLTTILPLVKYQDEHDGDFLKLRSTSLLPSAKQDIIDALTLIENGVNFITSETDDQLEDLITKHDITDLDADIDEEFADNDEDIPVPVLRNATDIVDLAQKLKSLLDGPFDVEIEDDEDGGTEIITVNLSAFLNNAIADIKDFLPYHQWADLNSLDQGIDAWELYPTTHWVDGEEVFMYWVDGVFYTYYWAIDEDVVDDEYIGTFSSDGVFTVDKKYDYHEGKIIELSPNDLLTPDGAFYLDSQGRFCITAEAYETINEHFAEIPRDSWEAMDLMEMIGGYMPTINFSVDHPLGVRDANGVFRFAGYPTYLEDQDEEIVYLVDANGNEVDDPIFPDPTFNGVLPGMTQERLEDLDL